MGLNFSKSKILVTGFEPFNGDDRNPSMEIALLLDNVISSKYTIQSLILPVSTHGAKTVENLLQDQFQYDLVIHLGLNALSDFVNVEICALNHVVKTQSDTDDQMVGPNILPSSCNLQKLLNYVSGHQMVQFSRDAGTYFCNETYYRSLNAARIKGLDVPVLFIHVPKVNNVSHVSKIVLGLINLLV